ncbi:unnamed protein product [Camellia sinensis]
MLVCPLPLSVFSLSIGALNRCPLSLAHRSPSPPMLTSVAHRHCRKSPSPSVFLSHRGSDCWVFAAVVVAGYLPKAYVCIRYRDFCTLYRRLKTLFTGQGWILPSTWSSVERVSRKIFGNVSPDVVAERSALIQECLRSILHSRFSSSVPSALIWFLSPQTFLPSSPAFNKSNP